jgi:hypothetical protein
VAGILTRFSMHGIIIDVSDAEGVLRGHRSGLLTVAEYNNLVGKTFAILPLLSD